jgi:hypothetical protein
LGTGSGSFEAAQGVSRRHTQADQKAYIHGNEAVSASLRLTAVARILHGKEGVDG